MTLQEHDTIVAPVLHRIESYSHAVMRAVRELPARPDFETKAEDAMSKTEQALIKALKSIQAAKKEYGRKQEVA